MPFIRRRRFLRRSGNRVRAIGGTRVSRSRVRKEFPKYVRGPAVSKRELHYFPDSISARSYCTFANTATLANQGNTAAGIALPAPGTAAVSCVWLNNVARGTGVDQRVGNSIFMRSLLIRGVVTNRKSYNTVALSEVAVNPSAGVGEILVIYDRDPDTTMTAPPAMADLFEHNWVMSPMKLDTRDRFDVLLRKKVVPTYDINAAGFFLPTRGIPIDMKVSLNRASTYKSAAANPTSPGDVRKGGLYIYFLSDYANNSADAPMFCGYLKLCYTDLE